MQPKFREHDVVTLMKDVLMYAGYPQNAILQEPFVTNEKGVRICPDIVVVDARTGSPIAIFEIKATLNTAKEAFDAARKEMKYFLNRCPCYVIAPIDGGEFAVSRIASRDAEFPTWIPLADKEQFKVAFGDYKNAVDYAEKLVKAQVSSSKASESVLCKVIFTILAVLISIGFGIAHICCKVPISDGYYNMVALLFSIAAASWGFSIHFKCNGLELSVTPGSK